MEDHSKNRPLVSVIIVNYNGCEYLGPCLQSVTEQSYSPVQIILVDNASTDDSVPYVRATFPDVQIIENAVNRGFAGGNNAGWAVAQGEYVALLNNDAVADPRWLETLVEALRARNLPLVCSLVITKGVPDEYYQCNGTLNFIGYNIMSVFSDRSMIFYASGAAMLLRRDAVDILFPEDYFLYHEDVYLSWKLRLRGENLAMVQSSIVRHRGSATTARQPSARVTFYQERNRLLTCLLFFEIWTLLRLIPYFVTDAVVKTALSLTGQGKSFVGILRAYFWILAHPLRVWTMRREAQEGRRVPDRTILSLMSARLANGTSAFVRVLNALSRGYATLVGLQHHG